MSDEGEGEQRGFVRDAGHWLFKLSPAEWIRAGLADLERAERAYAARNARAGLAGARRAAGMALNGALIVEPNDAWGRSYVDHLAALARDPRAPERVREACRELTAPTLPGPGSLVALRLSKDSSKADERVLEAARDVIAHAYAIVRRQEP
ncbi:MAG: hypothetical protein KF819_30895 [Labilithrix sp.]|nr:hypothetical protein [Labilithrix sp.]